MVLATSKKTQDQLSFSTEGQGPYTPALRPSQQGQAGPRSPPLPARERHKKKADLPNDHTSPIGLPRLPQPPSHLFNISTRALRTSAQPYPQHWLLRHVCGCWFEFEFAFNGIGTLGDLPALLRDRLGAARGIATAADKAPIRGGA